MFELVSPDIVSKGAPPWLLAAAIALLWSCSFALVAWPLANKSFDWKAKIITRRLSAGALKRLNICRISDSFVRGSGLLVALGCWF